MADPNFPGTQTFLITTTNALLSLATVVDYEVATGYRLIAALTDPGQPNFPGQIVFTVKIIDINDNCPVLEKDSFSFEPRPSLSPDPILILNATDKDAKNNSLITYLTSDPILYPSLSKYNSSIDLYKVIFPKKTTVMVSLVALDNGSPRRGAVARVNVTIVNKCLLSVLRKHLEYKYVVNATGGEVYFRIPKYWIRDFCKISFYAHFFVILSNFLLYLFNYLKACNKIAGMESGYVLEEQISASSHDPLGYPGRGRINTTYGKFLAYIN